MTWHKIAIPFLLSFALFASLVFVERSAQGQDWLSTGINLGATKIKLAVPDLPPKGIDQSLVGMTQVFNRVLWSDLEESGIFDLVSKSYYPLKVPEEPLDVDFKA
jgi:TolB protein